MLTKHDSAYKALIISLFPTDLNLGHIVIEILFVVVKPDLSDPFVVAVVHGFPPLTIIPVALALVMGRGGTRYVHHAPTK